MSEMFGISDSEKSSSSSSYESPDDEEEEALGSSTVNDEWTSTGQLPSFPFTNVGHRNAGPAESPFDFCLLFFNTTFMSILVSSINTHAMRLLKVKKVIFCGVVD